MEWSFDLSSCFAAEMRDESLLLSSLELSICCRRILNPSQGVAAKAYWGMASSGHPRLSQGS
uniref:Uncharacterized protein n=1 Tax=Solanum tuberosum TaxID=4113 RepID=M1CXY5_SOLTU